MISKAYQPEQDCYFPQYLVKKSQISALHGLSNNPELSIATVPHTVCRHTHTHTHTYTEREREVGIGQPGTSRARWCEKREIGVIDSKLRLPCKLQPALHGPLYFPRSTCGWWIWHGYVSDSHTQFRHLYPLNLMTFELKKLTLASKTTFLTFHMDGK